MLFLSLLLWSWASVVQVGVNTYEWVGEVGKQAYSVSWNETIAN